MNNSFSTYTLAARPVLKTTNVWCFIANSNNYNVEFSYISWKVAIKVIPKCNVYSFEEVRRQIDQEESTLCVCVCFTHLFAGYPYTTETQKAAKVSSKNSFFNWVHSLHTKLMNASHSTNLFTNSCDHISTNGKAPLHFHINHNTPQFLYSLWRRANARNVSFLNLSRW